MLNSVNHRLNPSPKGFGHPQGTRKTSQSNIPDNANDDKVTSHVEPSSDTPETQGSLPNILLTLDTPLQELPDKIDGGNTIQHSPEPLQDEPFNEIASPSLVLPDNHDDKPEPPPSVSSSSHHEGKTNELIPVAVPLPPDKVNDDNKIPLPQCRRRKGIR